MTWEIFTKIEISAFYFRMFYVSFWNHCKMLLRILSFGWKGSFWSNFIDFGSFTNKASLRYFYFFDLKSFSSLFGASEEVWRNSKTKIICRFSAKIWNQNLTQPSFFYDFRSRGSENHQKIRSETDVENTGGLFLSSFDYIKILIIYSYFSSNFLCSELWS